MERRDPNAMNKSNEKNKMNLSAILSKFKSRTSRAGGYSALTAILVIVLATAAVFGVDSLPTTVTKLDATENRLFSLSEQSEQIAKNVSGDIVIYVVVQPGNEDSALLELLGRYSSLNSRIKIERIDPVVSPNFLTQYTDDYLYENSLVVTSDERYQYISYHDVYETYTENGETKKSFAGENRITSAIDFVTSSRLPKAYRLTGHGEGVMSATLKSAISLENIAIEDLSLLTMDAVPVDCTALIILSPDSDLSAEEADKILSYLDGGGKLLLISDYVEGGLPNLARIAAHYGLTPVDGVVIEGDQDHSLRGYFYYLLPNVESHTITTPLRIGGYYVLLPLAQGLSVGDAPREGVTVTKILTTSDSAYAKTAGYNMTTQEREDGDLDGPFALGVAVSEDVGSGKEARFVWYTTSEMLQDKIDSLVSGANKDLLLNSLNWLSEREDSISIHSKSLSQGHLTVPTADAARISLLLILALPLSLIAAGVFVVAMRKRR